MLYLIDEASAYRTVFRSALYRRHMFSEGVDMSALQKYLPNDTNAVCVLLRPFTYEKEKREGLKSLCLAQNVPLIWMVDNSQIAEEGVIPLPLADEKHIALALEEQLVRLDEAGKCRYVFLQYHGIRDDLREKTTMLYGLPLPLTPTERMIMRYMLYALPQGATAEELIHFCLNPDRDFTLSNIPTHIRKINCAFFPCFGCRIITHKAGAYRLMESLPHSIVS